MKKLEDYKEAPWQHHGSKSDSSDTGELRNLSRKTTVVQREFAGQTVDRHDCHKVDN